MVINLHKLINARAIARLHYLAEDAVQVKTVQNLQSILTQTM